ncbi:hypothetical protein FZC70_19550 [Bacillus subtilis]|nr:hypothetical protein FZC70_19550 [Bacillus subtilis]
MKKIATYLAKQARHVGALFLYPKPNENLKKQHKTKKLLEKTSFSSNLNQHSDGCCFLLR